MKTVGIIGGLSPESTLTYYKWINERVREKLGGLNSAKILLSSLNFANYSELPEDGNWSFHGELLAQEAKKLESAGADFVVLATNTFHQVAEQIETKIKVPFLNLVDCVAQELESMKINRVGLLGTAHTMRLSFYKDRLLQYGINTQVPAPEKARLVSGIIYSELCKGLITDKSKSVYLSAIDELSSSGAEAVILGCTEINLLVSSKESKIPLIDSTEVHVNAVINGLLRE